MNTKLPLFISLFATTVVFGASSGVYVEAGIEASIENTQNIQELEYAYDRALGTNIALGYQANLWRFELEAIYKTEKLYSFANYKAEGDLSQNSQMLNVYYSGYNKSNFVSSIGLGAGISSLSLSNLKQVNAPQDDIKNNTIPAFQAIGSVGYMLNEQITATLKYKYFYTTKGDDFDAKGSSNISLNLRYLF